MQAIKGYLKALVTPQMAKRAVRVALLIGTLLFVINHGAAVRSGTMTQARWISAGLTYLVPYGVSVHGQFMGRGGSRSTEK
ncbi:nitrate/nitrite transporter NrtS [Leptolyngbya sp. CCNP1308]|uniref:nitrate/nitrite transporter NrtS n=1 Tax=Leptolyngbya sp. CCNP1308 TaxID=3110255 RepID=UPI002B1F672F|nr:nitrate/nitrite transporter NrtS [Leptolyngbya sp. CCNP1308]MEA5450877.1 nitrate/nitrite transporter NrtS [Leptolyngbya sp. CCNP1308]